MRPAVLPARHAVAAAVLVCGVAVAACAEREQHVFRAPPTRSPGAPPPRTPAAAPGVPGDAAVPAPGPIGSGGPAARITAVRDAATGGPVSLAGVPDSIDVVTVVAAGPQGSGAGAARIELTVHRGEELVLRHDPPAPLPTVVAHVFRLRRAELGLRGTQSELRVHLRRRDGTLLAQSVPVFVVAR